jgi:hypothetical protein
LRIQQVPSDGATLSASRPDYQNRASLVTLFHYLESSLLYPRQRRLP